MVIPGTLSVVLPAHNEVANLEAVVKRVLEVVPELSEDFEVIVVDDGSRDGTAELADRLATESTKVRVVHHLVNRGYGAALTSGFRAARGDAILFMDADQQFDPADLAHLAPFVRQADVVAGYRVKRRDPWIRLIYARVFNLSMRLLFGLSLRDIDCAFKVYRADLLRTIDLATTGALINTELLVKAQRAGARIVEVGVRHFPRPTGESSGGSARVILRAVRETVWLWWHMLSYRPPMVLPDRQPATATTFLVRAALLVAAGLGTLLLAAGWLLRRGRGAGGR
jgi:glycosyltransferase involved in cell wall biosynthesis